MVQIYLFLELYPHTPKIYSALMKPSHFELFEVKHNFLLQ